MDGLAFVLWIYGGFFVLSIFGIARAINNLADAVRESREPK